MRTSPDKPLPSMPVPDNPVLEPYSIEPYTVLLLYPDYMASDFGHETYLAWVEAPDAGKAIRVAQEEVMQSSDSESDTERDPDDFHCLACFKGHHNDYSSEQSIATPAGLLSVQ